MATELQVAANRLNAQKSTGPKSEEGKNASSQNALKHGLRAAELSFPGDFSNEAEGFIQEIEQEFDPKTPFEEMLVARIASQTWRLRRSLSFETAMLSRLAQKGDTDDSIEDKCFSVMERIASYEMKLERSLNRSINFLRKLQAERRGENEQAGLIRRAVDTLNKREKGSDPESNKQTRYEALLRMAESLKEDCETLCVLNGARVESEKGNERTQSKPKSHPPVYDYKKVKSIVGIPV